MSVGMDVDAEFAKADTTTNASTAPDSPLTETSSILSELPEVEEGDEESGGGRGGKNEDGRGEGEGEVVLKAVRPRRAVRDGTGGEFSFQMLRRDAGLVEAWWSDWRGGFFFRIWCLVFVASKGSGSEQGLAQTAASRKGAVAAASAANGADEEKGKEDEKEACLSSSSNVCFNGADDVWCFWCGVAAM